MKWCFTKVQRLQSEARNLSTSRCNHQVFRLISHLISPTQTQTYYGNIVLRGSKNSIYYPYFQ